MKKQAETLINQSEEALKKLEGSIMVNEKAMVEEKIDALKKAVQGDNQEEIKAKNDELAKEYETLSKKLDENVSQCVITKGESEGK